MAAYIKLLMLCLLFLVFGTQKSSALQPVNNGVTVTTAVKSHTHNVPSFDNSGHDLFDFNQGILLKKSVSDSANPYKQSNNFHPAIKTDAQRPITFKEDTSTYTLRNRVKPAQKIRCICAQAYPYLALSASRLYRFIYSPHQDVFLVYIFQGQRVHRKDLYKY